VRANDIRIRAARRSKPQTCNLAAARAAAQFFVELSLFSTPQHVAEDKVNATIYRVEHMSGKQAVSIFCGDDLSNH